MSSFKSIKVPTGIDTDSIVAAASALMLMPENATRLVRLHRLAVFGVLQTRSSGKKTTSGAIRKLLKEDVIGGPSIRIQEDDYSGPLVQSVRFADGVFLVSSGSGMKSVSDLESLIEAISWIEEEDTELFANAKLLIKGLLMISDSVLKKAGLARNVWPSMGELRNATVVPGTAQLTKLAESTFLSTSYLKGQGQWLVDLVDSLALNPGELTDPCQGDILEDRLFISPFLRCADGYRLVLPVDLAITIRYHLLKLFYEFGQLSSLALGWRAAVSNRCFSRISKEDLVPLERNQFVERYLVKLDDRRDIHFILATDDLSDWNLELWENPEGRIEGDRISQFLSTERRRDYSAADQVLHVVIDDSPGKGSAWFIPDISSSDLIFRVHSTDLEVILHHEPEGLEGFWLYSQACNNRKARSFSTGILDEYAVYLENDRSFYLSDDLDPVALIFEPNQGNDLLKNFYSETDRHGVMVPGNPPFMIEVSRFYKKDAPEIFVSRTLEDYFGFVVEVDEHKAFIVINEEVNYTGSEHLIMESLAFWMRECLQKLPSESLSKTMEVVLKVEDSRRFNSNSSLVDNHAVVEISKESNQYKIKFLQEFDLLLKNRSNLAERELVRILLAEVFGIPKQNVEMLLNLIAPVGAKRMISYLESTRIPEIFSSGFSTPLFAHEQVEAQLLDELGEWLTAIDGRGLTVGDLEDKEARNTLNSIVGFCFGQLESEIREYQGANLVEFLIHQNEALIKQDKIESVLLESRLSCFGTQSDTAAELAQRRKKSITAQRSNRFLIEYVAACPPTGDRTISKIDYFRLLVIAQEIIDRGTASDFLNFGLAKFKISILPSGRLGMNRDEPVELAMEKYVLNSGMRSVRDHSRDGLDHHLEDFNFEQFLDQSVDAMNSEFDFTLQHLREVVGGLLDLASENSVSRIDREATKNQIATDRGLSKEVVGRILNSITLQPRDAFLEIKQDAYPWLFNRDMSYPRRPLVLQGKELVFGTSSLHHLLPFWVDSLLSGRYQSVARTTEMKQCISKARMEINGSFAAGVAKRLSALGISTRSSVKKIGRKRIVDSKGQDLGDIDILAVDFARKTILAVEAKDFEIARTPAEMSFEIQKLFQGKKKQRSTIELHSRRLAWLKQHQEDVLMDFKAQGSAAKWKTVGLIVTSDPLVTPLVQKSELPVIPISDLEAWYWSYVGR